MVPANTVDIGFSPFSKWVARPDVSREIEELLIGISQEVDNPELPQTIKAEICADMYSQYLRRIGTLLLYFRQREIPARMVLEQAKGQSQPSVEMPDFVIEEVAQTGPLGIVGEIQAVVSAYSYWPGGNTNLEMIGAVIYTGKTHLSDLLFWFNPLVAGSVEQATEALMEELKKRGVHDIAVLNEVSPFRIGSDCLQVVLQGPLRDED